MGPGFDKNSLTSYFLISIKLVESVFLNLTPLIFLSNLLGKLIHPVTTLASVSFLQKSFKLNANLSTGIFGILKTLPGRHSDFSFINSNKKQKIVLVSYLKHVSLHGILCGLWWFFRGTHHLKTNLESHFFLLSVLPEVKPLHYRVYSGERATTELACLVEGYPEPMVSTVVGCLPSLLFMGK